MGMFLGHFGDDEDTGEIDRESELWKSLRYAEYMDSSMFVKGEDIDERADQAYLKRRQECPYEEVRTNSLKGFLAAILRLE